MLSGGSGSLEDILSRGTGSLFPARFAWSMEGAPQLEGRSRGQAFLLPGWPIVPLPVSGKPIDERDTAVLLGQTEALDSVRGR
jgi:hypothetical protein